MAKVTSTASLVLAALETDLGTSANIFIDTTKFVIKLREKDSCVVLAMSGCLPCTTSGYGYGESN